MKIRAVKREFNYNEWFTEGKVYEVVNGEVRDEQNYLWKGFTTIEVINNMLRGEWVFELVTTKPTEEQLRNLKPGDKVRLISDRGPGWNSSGEMDKYCNQVVTIKTIFGSKSRFHIEEIDKYECNWTFRFTDIVEIISSDPVEPVKEVVKPAKPWKESLIDQIKQLPFEGGIISLTVCERERARIIELIEAM